MNKNIIIIGIFILILVICLAIFNFFNPFQSDEEKIVGIWKSENDLRTLIFYSGGHGLIDNNAVKWVIKNDTLEIKIYQNINIFEYRFSNFNNIITLNDINSESSPYSTDYYRQ